MVSWYLDGPIGLESTLPVTNPNTRYGARMIPHMVSFPDDLWQLLVKDAQREGVSVSELIRQEMIHGRFQAEFLKDIDALAAT
jgi:hypothetical protein